MKSRKSWMISRAGKLGPQWLVMVLAIGALPAIAENRDPAPASPFDMNKLADVIKDAIRTGNAAQPQTTDKNANGEPLIEVPATREDEADTEAQPPDVRVSPEGQVEMHVRNLDLASVLQMLSIQSRRNIVASQNVSGTVTANLYNVTFEEALTAILESNNCRWRRKGNFINVYTNQEVEEMIAAARQRESRLFRLYYTRAADVQVMIQPLLSTEGIVSLTPPAEVGIPTGSDQTGGDALALQDCILVIDYQGNLEQIAQLIKKIDVRPQQLLIEATILNAQLSEDNALGIDFNLLGGVDFQDLSSTSPGVTDLTTGNLPQPNMQKTNFTVRTDFNAAFPEGGFTFGIVKDNIAAFIRALETVTDTTVLANPKVLVLNKQRGEVIVGRRDGYLTTTVTETSAIQTVEFLETGTQMVFRPFIGDDDYVRMEIHPKDSTGGLTAANLPSEQTTEVTTNIMVKDGNTILIGGLFREVTFANRSQVPFLGNIPVAGSLFRLTRDNTQREEIIILLTVRILKEQSDENKADADLLQDVERYRVGMRQELQWFGRERLAQAHYRWAIEHLNKGNISGALWDLDLALNNNPRFLTAIQLKEKLLARREWDDDGSTVRTFIRREIMKEQGTTEPFFGRPGPPFDLSTIQGPNGFDDGSATPPLPPTLPHEHDAGLPSESEGKGGSR